MVPDRETLARHIHRIRTKALKGVVDFGENRGGMLKVGGTAYQRLIAMTRDWDDSDAESKLTARLEADRVLGLDS